MNTDEIKRGPNWIVRSPFRWQISLYAPYPLARHGPSLSLLIQQRYADSWWCVSSVDSVCVVTNHFNLICRPFSIQPYTIFEHSSFHFPNQAYIFLYNSRLKRDLDFPSDAFTHNTSFIFTDVLPPAPWIRSKFLPRYSDTFDNFFNSSASTTKTRD